MAAVSVVGIGEVLWDLLPAGPQLGGAPANFAYHAHALGAFASVVSRVGNDQLGRDVFARFQSMGLQIKTLQTDPEAATGTVIVSLTPEGLPDYTIKEEVAWDLLAVTDAAVEVVLTADAVCFGTLAQRSPISRTAIQHLVSSTKPSSLRVLDLNLRQHYYSRELVEGSLNLANVLKLNENELTCLAKMFDLTGDMRSQLSQLIGRYDLQVAACTRGAEGSAILANGKWSDCAGVPAKVVDTIGAGDAFTAAMVVGLLLGWNLDLVNIRANEVASFVASCAGATPQLPGALVSPFRRGS
jgi:fructokinase